ncbi:hypothetical protein [Candidatus Ulvibacter alkanivorans]|uniref:hypothetical protein n=1 Tax=Candidatus Ulvibacter alkanivorans TaxID=2267620 RepID=UPI000DF1F405|nr:hypothetical protein [Candidatus Ulvibacter alkanivorans]
MTTTLRNTLFIILGVVIFCIAALLISNLIVKNKVEAFLTNDLPPHIQNSYDELSVNMLNGTLTLKQALVAVRNQTNDTIHTNFSAEKITIEDLDYWDYLFNDLIHFEAIQLSNATIEHHKNKYNSTKDSTNASSSKLKRAFLIGNLSVDNTTISMYDGTSDSTALYTDRLMIDVDSIRMDSQSITEKIPFAYGAYTVKTDTVFLKVSAYENMTIQQLELQQGALDLKQIKLFTKYSRDKHAQLLEKERDHFDLRIDSLQLAKIDFGFTDDTFFAESHKLVLSNPKLDIFRNKLVADDPSIKPLYSKMLRELPFALTIDSVAIKNGAIAYTEKVKQDNPGGTITFSALDAQIANMSNTYGANTKTEIHIDAQFMEQTPFTVDWNFDVNDQEDRFLFKSDVGPLTASRLNKFTEPNLGVKMEGATNKTYFTISGGNEAATIDLRINYDEFKVTVMEKDEKNDKNWFLSAVANLFISKNSDDSENDFREGSAQVSRVKNRSFFNYLWLNVEAGLRKNLL